jgi:hypothetical protein
VSDPFGISDSFGISDQVSAEDDMPPEGATGPQPGNGDTGLSLHMPTGEEMQQWAVDAQQLYPPESQSHPSGGSGPHWSGVEEGVSPHVPMEVDHPRGGEDRGKPVLPGNGVLPHRHQILPQDTNKDHRPGARRVLPQQPGLIRPIKTS